MCRRIKPIRLFVLFIIWLMVAAVTLVVLLHYHPYAQLGNGLELWRLNSQEGWILVQATHLPKGGSTGEKLLEEKVVGIGRTSSYWVVATQQGKYCVDLSSGEAQILSSASKGKLVTEVSIQKPGDMQLSQVITRYWWLFVVETVALGLVSMVVAVERKSSSGE